MKIRVTASVLFGACFTVSGCATEAMPRGDSSSSASGGISVANVMEAYEQAVVSYCVRNVLMDEEIKDIEAANPDLSSVSEPSGSRQRGMFSAEAGEAWILDRSGDIVSLSLNEQTGTCEVSAYGPPARQTASKTADAIRTQWGGEPISFERRDEPMFIDERFTVSHDGRTAEIFLGGNEPGAPGRLSRFSTLIATVRPVQPGTK